MESEKVVALYPEHEENTKSYNHPPLLNSMPINSMQASSNTEGLNYISINQIQPSRFQTREFVEDESTLDGLTQSILNKGVIQPIIVRPLIASAEKPYELVAGERRLRAATRAGLTIIPALIQKIDDREAIELGIIENAQRENLNAVEEALTYKQLVNDFDLTQSEIAQAVGKSRSYITNSIRLLQLDPRVLELLRTQELSAAHGRTLLAITEPERQYRLALKTIESGLSVHALERMVANITDPQQNELSDEELAEQDSLRRQETRLSNLLDIEKIRIAHDPQGRKRLTITFDSEAAWKRFMGRVRE